MIYGSLGTLKQAKRSDQLLYEYSHADFLSSQRQHCLMAEWAA